MRLGPLLGATAAALGLLLWSSTSATLSGWPTATVTNQTNSGLPATLAFTHSAGPCTLGPRVTGSVTCPGSPAPTTASAATPVTGSDTITDNGTVPASGLSRSVKASSCAAVRLDNRVGARPVLLPRYKMAFRATDKWGGTNAVTLDGASYAASVASETEPTPAPLARYGMGIWFKASSGQSGPLFSLDTSPVNTPTSGGDDRTVFLKPNGTVAVAYNTTGLTLSTTTAYADGAWHFAYVTIANVSGAAVTSLSVDTALPVSTNLGTYSSVTGYWHLGWGPTALTSLSTAYFTGSLSNLVIFDSSSATPAAPLPPTAADLASQGAFTSWAGNASDHWLLGDSGTTTYTGNQPVIGTTSPCTMLNIGWSFASPSATGVTTMLLSAFATGTAYSVSVSPGPGASQTGTITISRAGTYNAYVAGLRLYVPFSDTVSTSTGKWPLIFTWDTSDGVVIA